MQMRSGRQGVEVQTMCTFVHTFCRVDDAQRVPVLAFKHESRHTGEFA